MKLYFVRHGESEANLLHLISNRDLEHGLTERGRQQAAELAQSLCGVGACRIFTSPLLRAVQTAEILSSALGTDYEVTDALREFDCGIAEGRSDARAWELHQQVMKDWLQDGNTAARIEQGESLIDIRERFLPFVECLVEDAGSVASILVGHGGLYLCMLPIVLMNAGTAAALPFPNAAYVLAEARPEGLVCLEWCGQPMAGQAAGADGW
jgi:probable phosphoglycerate mutase